MIAWLRSFFAKPQAPAAEGLPTPDFGDPVEERDSDWYEIGRAHV